MQAFNRVILYVNSFDILCHIIFNYTSKQVFLLHTEEKVPKFKKMHFFLKLTLFEHPQQRYTSIASKFYAP